ncbi:putative DNA binding domain-containing protein [Granulosicoccus sp.]|nr:ATP-binding protein [Granulosicoccus sp.]MDB4223816.1 putative DNA binding domain-containing protein [Granulosicoccus sp.]
MSDEGQLHFDFEAPSELMLMSAAEIFEIANESVLREIAEDRRFEAKPKTFAPKSIGEYVNMWANTANGGLIAVGIRNDNIFEGCKSMSQKDLNDIEKCPDIYCPDAHWTSKRIEIQGAKGEQDFIILFLIHYVERRVVWTNDRKVFVRRADSCKQLKSPDEIRHLQIEKGEISFEKGPAALNYPDDFDPAIIHEFVETVRAAKGWNEEHSTEDILQLMHLGKHVKGDFMPNISLVLLLARDPRELITGCRIRFLRFEGEYEGTGSKWNAVKDEFIDGPIPTQIVKAAGVVKSQLRTFSRLNKDNKFFTTLEYPDEAWYEAIVNACVHRAYSNGLGTRTIYIKMFDDRLVVESPGGFPTFVTPENIYSHSSPRNPIIMDAMYYLKFVKCAHEGTRRIRDTMLNMELPAPEFAQIETGSYEVRVTLRNNIKQRKVWVDSDVASVIGGQVASTLTESEKRCINHVAEYDEISVSDAQRLTGMSWPAAKKMLLRLADLGIFFHRHTPGSAPDPGARFVLNKPKS